MAIIDLLKQFFEICAVVHMSYLAVEMWISRYSREASAQSIASVDRKTSSY